MGLLRNNNLKGLFGEQRKNQFGIPMPGPISGYGGGTFDLGGQQITPVDQGGYEDMPQHQLANAGSEQPKEKKEGFFGKLLGGDFMDRAARAMAFANDDYAGAAQISGQMHKQAQERANKEALSKTLAGMNLTPEMRAMLGNNPDLAERVVFENYKQQNAGPDYENFEDNAGNRWRADKRSGKVEDNPYFVDKAPKQFYDPSNGRVVNVPNPYMQSGPKPGEAVDGYIYQGGDPKSQSSWAPANQQMPMNAQQGGQGFAEPPTLTPQQYQAIVAAKGKAAADAYIQQYGFKIGGF